MRSRWVLGTLLLAAGCGGSAVYSPTSDKAEAVAGAPAAPAYPERGVGGAPPLRPQPTKRTCEDTAQSTLFAQPIAITGIQIALTETHVYWNDGSALVRQAKAGGAPEQVVAVSPNGFRIAANGDRLFWEDGSDIVSTSLAAPTAGERLAARVLPGEWAVSGDRLSYMVDPGGFDGRRPSTLESMPLGGGPTLRVVLTAPTSPAPVAADATGVYWHYNQSNDPNVYVGDVSVGGSSFAPGLRGSRIQKLTYATGQISDFAPAAYIGFGGLQSDGEWLVWADNDNVSTTVYQAKPDGSMLGALGQASLVRGLAVHGSTVFWAASLPGDDRSDIWSAALGTDSAPRLVACGVQSIYGLRADANDIYYFTWTENPIIGKIPIPR